jgi:FkbM family methyltransferase
LLNSPAAFVDILLERDFHYGSFRMSTCAARDQVACTAAAFGWRHFERPMPAYFAQAVRAAGNGVVVDVGANTGFYTLLAVSASARVSVVAYEPFATVRALLEANLLVSPRRRAVRVLPFAVSDSGGRRVLYVPDAGHGLVETSASLGADFKTGAVSGCVVDVVTLDAQWLGDGRRVGVIKVDAEGHDLAVLRGAMGVLKRDRPVVFVEVLLGADEDGLTRVLQECGYVDYALFLDGPPVAHNVVRHETTAWNHMWLPREMRPFPV